MQVTRTALAMDFPIRPGFLAQIVIPRDLTKAEADRLCAFVMNLAAPENESDVARWRRQDTIALAALRPYQGGEE